jgi:molybdate-binding protein/DNA-binding XRE family transcriptional regulator
MPYGNRFDNRVKLLRQGRGWTQEQLAQAAGLSRTGIGAIEAARLIPSVAAALALARALGCTVEDLFGPKSAAGPAQFAWLPANFPCRHWLAEVAGKTLLYPVEIGLRSDLPHDGVAKHASDVPANTEVARTTLVLATCDPAAGYLAAMYERNSGYRLLVLTRTSSDALELAKSGLAHVAGIHFAAADDRHGNAAELSSRAPGCDMSLVHVARWEEGLASQPAAQVRSAAAAARSKMRWIGRLSGAAARRYQDDLLGKRRAPRHIARDHRGVVDAIRNEWADVGICLRLTTEEAQLAFLGIGEENYDLCFRQEFASDPRIVRLIATICSPEYRQLLAELPGYREQRHLGEIEHVSGRH